jgi:eukaryotic translation initiation factor 2C
VFACPRRPNIGREGRIIGLRANHFQITMPRGFVHHYDINIQPDKCPRKVNREIIETMVHAYSKIFGTLKPVFDGRNNLYTRDPLPIGTDKLELEVKISHLHIKTIFHDVTIQAINNKIFIGNLAWRR